MLNRSYDLNYAEAGMISLSTGERMQKYVRTHLSWFTKAFREANVEHQVCLNYQVEQLESLIASNFQDADAAANVLKAAWVHRFENQLNNQGTWKGYWANETWGALDKLTRMVACAGVASRAPKELDNLDSIIVGFSLELITTRYLYEIAPTTEWLCYGKDDGPFPGDDKIKALSEMLEATLPKRIEATVRDLRYRITSA